MLINNFKQLLAKKKQEKELLKRTASITMKRHFQITVILMFMMQLFLPIISYAEEASDWDEQTEPQIEMQAVEADDDDDGETGSVVDVNNVDDEKIPPADETPEKPGEDVVDEPVSKPEKNTNEQPPPTKTEPKEEAVDEKKPINNKVDNNDVKEKENKKEQPKAIEKPVETEQTQEVEEETEEDVTEDEEGPGAMLDGFPATKHPENVTAIKRFAAGSLGSGLVLSRQAMQRQSTSTLAPGEVKTTKTAQSVPGMVNTWDITVRIEGRDNNIVETTDVVLVIDRSGSMDDDGRMTNAKAAAKNFIDAMIKPPSTSLRIAVVSFSSDYTERNRTSKLINVDHDFSTNRTTLKNAVDGLRALGGTHTQAGIIQGQAKLTGSGADNKYMVLLSDGQPTYSYRPINWARVGTTTTYDAIYDGNYETGVNSVVGDGSNLTRTYWDGNNWRYIHNGNAAIKAGVDARPGIDGLFTIAVQAGTNGTTILASIASPGMAYSTQNPTELTEIYDRIATQIQTQNALRNVKITDEMGDGFSLVANTVQKTEGITAIANADGTKNDTITWTIDPAVEKLVAGTTDVRYAEMTYRVEINDSLLNLEGAKTDEHKLFNTNKVTELKYKNIQDQEKTVHITSPKVDPVLLKMKKTLVNPKSNENRKFNVQVKKTGSGTGFDQTKALIPNVDSIWLTSLRYEGDYNVAETGITGDGATDLNQFMITYEVDGENQKTFKVNHVNGIPRGDVTIHVTNREIAKIDVTAEKIWIGGPAEKPAIQLQLYRNDVAYGAAILLPSGTTTYTWSDLDEVDKDGEPYVYTVKELNTPENYESVVEDFTITNTYVIPTNGQADATKRWLGPVDDHHQVDLTLWRTVDDEIFEEVTLFDLDVTHDSETARYYYEWAGLEKTNFEGMPYSFYFTEENVAGYDRIYDNPLIVDGVEYEPAGGQVTNQQMTIDFSFTKVDETGAELAGSEFTLAREDDGTLVTNSGTDPEFIFAGLTEGHYLLKEVKAPAGYTLPTVDWIIEVVRNTKTGALELIIPDDSFLSLTDEGYQFENKEQGEFPQTGGLGILSYFSIGLLTIMSSIGIYLKKEKNGGREND